MTKQTNSPRNRNLEIRRVRVADIEEAPWNAREHSVAQEEAFGEVVEDIGWFGHPDVFLTEAGKVMLCDGHLRKKYLIAKYGENTEIDVNVTDFTEDEAKVAMLTKDPLAAMATQNIARQQELIAKLQSGQQDTIKRIMEGQQATKQVEQVKEATKTTLKPILPAPDYSWVLIGIETVRYGEISERVAEIGKVDGILIQSVSNNKLEDPGV